MTGNNIGGDQRYAFGQVHQEEYGQNNGSDSFEIHNQFCMTETQVNRVNNSSGLLKMNDF